MSGRVGELFGDGPAPTRQPRFRWMIALLVVGLPLDLLGLVSCASLPGALLTWWALRLAGEDLDHAAAGELSVEHVPALSRVKQVATWALGWCAFTFLVQMALLNTGALTRWLGGG